MELKGELVYGSEEARLGRRGPAGENSGGRLSGVTIRVKRSDDVSKRPGGLATACSVGMVGLVIQLRRARATAGAAAPAWENASGCRLRAALRCSKQRRQ